jgi:hypothetical protein
MRPLFRTTVLYIYLDVRTFDKLTTNPVILIRENVFHELYKLNEVGCRLSASVFWFWNLNTGRMSSSGMLLSAAFVRTDVSGECNASIITVKRIDDIRTILAVTSKWRKPVLTRASRCHIPEDGILHSHSYENLGSYTENRFVNISIQTLLKKFLGYIKSLP